MGSTYINLGNMFKASLLPSVEVSLCIAARDCHVKDSFDEMFGHLNESLNPHVYRAWPEGEGKLQNHYFQQ